MEERIENETLRLSDAFLQKQEEYQLELTCEVYNINPGNNSDVMEHSKVLSGYTEFVEKVRKKLDQDMEIKEAVREAIDECIKNGILKEFFQEKRKEVEEVAALDFTFERREELIRRDSFEEGKEKGIEHMLPLMVELLIKRTGDEEQSLLEVAETTKEDLDQVRAIWYAYKRQN